MRGTVFFIGRWVTNIALACLAIATSVKPEDAMSNLSGWATKFNLPDPAWLQSHTADNVVFWGAVCAFFVLWAGPAVWRNRHSLLHRPKAQDRKATKRGAEIGAAIVPRRARIVFGTGHPFETVAPAGKNQNRTVRVKIENIADVEITNGTLSVLNLDPPQNEHKNFFLKGDISLGPRRHVYVDVAYYSEGTSEAPPGRSMRLCVPIPPAFFNTLPGTLPLSPHTFHLQLSSLEDHTLDEAYCRLFVDQNHVLHLENRGDSSRMAQV
jgi:hypothetical protein